MSVRTGVVQVLPASQLSEASCLNDSDWSRKTMTTQEPRMNVLGSSSRLTLPACGRFCISPRRQPLMPRALSVINGATIRPGLV
jgi:hypothetical protein